MHNRLKALRAERGWSQAVLGEHLDISRQSVNAIETGRYDPSLPLAFRIARLFDERRFAAGDLIQQEGTQRQYLVIILEGEVAVSNRLSRTKQAAETSPPVPESSAVKNSLQ